MAAQLLVRPLVGAGRLGLQDLLVARLPGLPRVALVLLARRGLVRQALVHLVPPAQVVRELLDLRRAVLAGGRAPLELEALPELVQPVELEALQELVQPVELEALQELVQLVELVQLALLVLELRRRCRPGRPRPVE